MLNKKENQHIIVHLFWVSPANMAVVVIVPHIGPWLKLKSSSPSCSYKQDTSVATSPSKQGNTNKRRKRGSPVLGKFHMALFETL